MKSNIKIQVHFLKLWGYYHYCVNDLWVRINTKLVGQASLFIEPYQKLKIMSLKQGWMMLGMNRLGFKGPASCRRTSSSTYEAKASVVMREASGPRKQIAKNRKDCKWFYGSIIQQTT